MGESRFIAAQDGLRLHALEWGDRRSPLLPVVCLPGLTRTAEDFTTLATAGAVTSPVGSAAPRKPAGGVRRYGPTGTHATAANASTQPRRSPFPCIPGRARLPINQPEAERCGGGSSSPGSGGGGLAGGDARSRACISVLMSSAATGSAANRPGVSELLARVLSRGCQPENIAAQCMLPRSESFPRTA
jgi:hypothetical protein